MRGYGEGIRTWLQANGWEWPDATDEITRLRAAGDALAEVADEWPELVEAWQEARRER